MQSGQCLQKRGFARAIVADQGRQASRLKGACQAMHDFPRPVPQGHVVQPDGRRRHRIAQTTPSHTAAIVAKARIRRDKALDVGASGSVMVMV